MLFDSYRRTISRTILLAIFAICSLHVVAQNGDRPKIKGWLKKSRDHGLLKDQRMYYAEKAIKSARKNDFDDLAIEGHECLGEIYLYHADFIDAIKISRNALSEFDFSEHPVLLGDIYLIIGCAYGDMKKSTTANSYFLKALRIYERENDMKGMIRSHNNLGNISNSLKEHEKARKHLFEALDLNSKVAEKKYMRNAVIIAQIGDTYAQEGNTETAILYYQKAKRATKPNEYRLNTVIDTELGGIYLDLGRLDSAMYFANRALKYASKLPPLFEVDLYGFRGRVFLATGDFDLAEENLLTTLNTVRSVGMQQDEQRILQLLSELEEKRGDMDKALHYATLAMNVRDSVYSEEFDFSKQQNDSLLAFESDLRKLAAENHTEELERQKRESSFLILIVSTSGLAFLLIVLILIYRRRSRVRQERIRLEGQLKQVEKDRLAEMVRNQTSQIAQMAVMISEEIEFVHDVKSQLDASEVKSNSEIQELHVRLINQISVFDNVEGLFERLNAAHADYYEMLKERYEMLSEKDLRLIGLTMLELSNKQISNLLGITIKNVEMSKYRLKTKLGIDDKGSLSEFVKSLLVLEEY